MSAVLPPPAIHADAATTFEVPERGSAAEGGAGLARIAVPALVFWIVALLLLRWPAFEYPLFSSNATIDAAFFAYAGELLRQGGTPYVSYWDHKPPLVHLIDAAALSLSGGGLWGVWAVSVATLLVALLLGFVAMRRAFGRSAAVLGATYFACSLPIVLASNLTEEYALPVQWAAALLVVRWTGAERASYRLGCVLGVLGALGFFLRANLVGAAATAAIVITIALLASGRTAPWLRFVAGALGGAGLVAAAILGYLAHEGALAPFWEQAFRYNSLYASSDWGMRARAAVAALAEAPANGSLLLPAAGWIAAAHRLLAGRHDGGSRCLSLFAVLWLPVELALVSVSGRPYTHYFTTVLPLLSFLAALAAAELVALAASVPRATRRFGPTALVAALAAVIAAWATVATLVSVRDDPPVSDRARQVTATAAFVRAKTTDGVPLLVWGHAADVHFFSQRRPASRFIYSLPLLTPGYADSALVAGFIAELRAAAPPLIVDATANADLNDDLVPPLGRWDPSWRYPTNRGPTLRWWAAVPALEPFYDYVAANYVVTDSVGPLRWAIYRRVSPPLEASVRAVIP